MKLKFFTLLLLFVFGTNSSFAVIDVKKKEHQESFELSQNDNFKTDWFGNRKVKKRKFRLRDFFTLRKKIKKSTKKKTPRLVGLGGAFLITGFVLFVIGGSFTAFILSTLSLLLSLISAVFGLRKITDNPEEFEGKAIAWVIIGISSLLLALIPIVLFILVF